MGTVMSFTLDPQVAEAVAPIAAATAGSTPPPVGDIAARRAALEGIFQYADTAQPFPDDVTINDHELTTADGATIRLRWYARKDAPGEPGPAALYLHGGGMIVGYIGLFDGLVSRYVSASGTPILSVDYRLAPEHPTRSRSRTPTPPWSGCTRTPPTWEQGEHGPVGRWGSGLADLPSQHCHLVAQNEDLHVLVDVGAEPQHQELRQSDDQLVENDASTTVNHAEPAAVIVR
jgi:hypothetical protein